MPQFAQSTEGTANALDTVFVAVPRNILHKYNTPPTKSTAHLSEATTRTPIPDASGITILNTLDLHPDDAPPLAVASSLELLESRLSAKFNRQMGCTFLLTTSLLERHFLDHLSEYNTTSRFPLAPAPSNISPRCHYILLSKPVLTSSSPETALRLIERYGPLPASPSIASDLVPSKKPLDYSHAVYIQTKPPTGLPDFHILGRTTPALRKRSETARKARSISPGSVRFSKGDHPTIWYEALHRFLWGLPDSVTSPRRYYRTSSNQWAIPGGPFAHYTNLIPLQHLDIRANGKRKLVHIYEHDRILAPDLLALMESWSDSILDLSPSYSLCNPRYIRALLRRDSNIFDPLLSFTDRDHPEHGPYASFHLDQTDPFFQNLSPYRDIPVARRFRRALLSLRYLATHKRWPSLLNKNTTSFSRLPVVLRARPRHNLTHNTPTTDYPFNNPLPTPHGWCSPTNLPLPSQPPTPEPPLQDAPPSPTISPDPSPAYAKLYRLMFGPKPEPVLITLDHEVRARASAQPLEIT